MVVVKKRSSGAQRRAYTRARKSGALFGLLRPGRPGRPKGATSRIEKRMSDLRKDLAWIGNPKLSDLALARMLLNNPEYRDNYKGISERALRRDVAVVQHEIWGPKMKRGQNSGQKKL